MNSRLVESIAQIVLAMSAEERQRFERIIDAASSSEPLANGSDQSSSDQSSFDQSSNEQNNQKDNKQTSNVQKTEAALSKDAQVAQIAQQMQEFEEQHARPLSPLPND